MMAFRHSQRGLSLLLTLVMLTVITLFAVSMMRLSTINASIVGNMQAQKTVESEAQQAIEIAVNQFAFFNDVIKNQNAWSGNTASLDFGTLWTNYKGAGTGSTAPATLSSIKLSRPQCTYFTPSSGYSALSGVAPQDTYWDIGVTATDSLTAAASEVHQGVRMRLPAGNCP
jgi:type IV pilus assembly protein PilX